VSGVTGKTSMDAFKRMEDKVEALEAAAEVSQSMGTLGALSAGSDIEREFKLLEAGSAVDDELARMKQNLLSPSAASSSSSTSSSSTSSSTGSSKPVDDELEKLKKEAGL
jgi:phage shock protein A